MNWIILIIVLFVFIIWQKKVKRKQQLKYIENYFFHKGIRKKISLIHPHLSDQQLDLVFDALKDYFQICLIANKQMVAMPSQVVDDAWHEFILSTRFYSIFCKKALGRFLHHTPTEAMSSPTLAQQGIKRAWRLACANEGINPKHPITLPLIFAIDGQLNIENGFIYQLNCMDANNKDNGYCASHIGCSSGCSGDSGSDSSDGSGSSFFGDSDSDSGGSDCGGGGCGGD